MITRVDKDSYLVSTLGREINIELAWEPLKERLLSCGVWTNDQVEELKTMSIGDNTLSPKGRYV